MKTNNIYLISLVLLLNACVNNKLDEEIIIDCTISNINFSTTSSNATCGQKDGSIEIEASGGEAPYMYSFNDGTPQSDPLFINLVSGSYKILVTDRNLCAISKDVTVMAAGGFQATASVTIAGCETTNGTITAVPSNGVEPYSFNLDGIVQSNATFNNLGAGSYELEISDATGCNFTIVKTVPTGISYDASVKQIIANNCSTSGCHDGSTAQTNFSIFTNVQGSAAAIKTRTQNGSMPKNGSISQEQKDAIACWVDDGAKDN